MVMTLRERYKASTRVELARAAFRLAIERGPANVRVGDIAAEAGVSPRTFNNYFSSKEAAIIWLVAYRVSLTGAALRTRPPDEPLGVALCEAFAERYEGASQRATDPSWVEGFRLVLSDPALRGEYLRELEATEAVLAEAIADRVNAEAEDVLPHLIAASTIAAERVGLRRWLASDTPVPLADAVRDAIGKTLAGVRP